MNLRFPIFSSNGTNPERIHAEEPHAKVAKDAKEKKISFVLFQQISSLCELFFESKHTVFLCVLCSLCARFFGLNCMVTV